MSPRVLLVDGRPDVIAAVRKRFEGYEVCTAATFEGARKELESGAFQLVLCDPAAAGSAIARSVGGGRRAAAPPEKYPARERASAASPGARRFVRRLLAVMSEGPCPERAKDVLGALVRELHAEYAALVRTAHAGTRIIFETRRDASALPEMPVAMLDAPSSAVHAEESQGLLWVRAPAKSPLAIVAAFKGMDRESLDAFAECATAAARFALRCISPAPRSDHEAVILSAVYHLVHDMRNLVTGLSLGLGALRSRRGAGRPAGADDAAVVERLVAPLAALSREYGRFETAASFYVAGSLTESVLGAYPGLLKTLGVHVESAAVHGQSSLAALDQGLLSRALVHTALALVEVRAGRVRLEGQAADGWQRVNVSFVSPMPFQAVAANGPLTDACDLINAKGGCASVEERSGRIEVAISVADNCPKPVATEHLT